MPTKNWHQVEHEMMSNRGATQIAHLNDHAVMANAGTNLANHAAEHAGLGGVQRKKPLKARPRTLTSDAPTITWSATAPSSGLGVTPWLPNVRPVGHYITSNDTVFGILQIDPKTGFVGHDFILTGSSVTIGWKSGAANNERFMFWIDDYPVSLSPQAAGISTTTSGYYYVTLTFSGSARRRIEVLGTAIAAWVGITIPVTASISAAPKRRQIHIVGDSFNGGSAATATGDMVPGSQLALFYDCSVSISGLGGSGYTNAGAFTVFGDATRVASAAAIQPDDIVFMGSVNDDGRSGIQAAATAAYAAYKAAVPTANLIVFGPQPSNATDTISANRQANCAAIQAAAVAAGATYYDMIGFTAETVAAYSMGVAYPQGQIVSYLGSLWRLDYAGTFTGTNNNNSPGGKQTNTWTLLTCDLFGTGNSGSTTGNGSRDVLLYSDGVHPTATQCTNLAQRMATAVIAATS
jgi:hypothetical protein